MHYDYVCLASSCSHLTVALPKLHPHIQHFHHGERTVTLEPSLQGKSVLLLTSMAGEKGNANDYLMETLITLRALRQAQHITLGMVYGAYTRQADGGQWMYSLLGDADDVWILDPHVPPPKPIQARTTGLLWADNIRDRFTQMPLIVSPDKGGQARAHHVAQLLGAELCILSKRRTDREMMIEASHGDAIQGRTCVVVDDIVDSGQTLLAAYHYLQTHGAKDVHACITHALMNEAMAQELAFHYTTLTISNSVYRPDLPNRWYVVPFADS